LDQFLWISRNDALFAPISGVTMAQATMRALKFDPKTPHIEANTGENYQLPRMRGQVFLPTEDIE